MGSNLSNKQEQLLTNNFQDIKLFLDDDVAGVNAARKIAEQLSKYPNVKITIISNPSQCKDLSELITNYSNNQILLALNENDLSIIKIKNKEGNKCKELSNYLLLYHLNYPLLTLVLLNLKGLKAINSFEKPSIMVGW